MAIVQFDRDVLATWAEHGIPDDLSTLEYARRLIPQLCAELLELESINRELLSVLDAGDPA